MVCFSVMEKREEVSSYGVDLPNGLWLGLVLINNLYAPNKVKAFFSERQNSSLGLYLIADHC